MGPFLTAWLVGIGLMTVNSVTDVDKKTGKLHLKPRPIPPPGPGQLLWASGVFVLLALLAESEKARPVAVTLAWGFDIAAFLNIFDPELIAKTGVQLNNTPIKPNWPPDKLPDDVLFPGGQTASSGDLTDPTQPKILAPGAGGTVPYTGP